MQYRKDKYGNDLSVLGFGCMRFTSTAGKIDIDKAQAEILAAYENGVNYFDTAYVYGDSEAAIGEIFERTGIRDNIYIATKLPHYLIKSREGIEKIFNEECKRLRTDHVDYYLMHMLTDVKTWERLKGLGIVEWLEEKKASGQIKQIGFSYHGNTDMFIELLDSYNWDFTQIQYNYIDEHSQAGRTGLEYAQSKGIPVIIMEPLRGGKLVNMLPKAALKDIEEHPSGRSAAEWGLGWLYDQSGVTVVLSGMNSKDMVLENCRIASEYTVGSYTEDDQKFIGQLIQSINSKMKVGCTGCRYCMPCPKNVDIPGTFAAYNRKADGNRMEAFREYYMCTALRADYTGPANCIECGKCEQHCPQGIEIRKELKEARKSLETPVYKVARKVAPLFLKY